MDSRQKLSRLRTELEPLLRQKLEGLGPMGAFAAGFVQPQVEALCDDWLSRDAAELDARIAALVDALGRLRSDDAPAILCRPDGSHYASYEIGASGWLPGHPVRGPAVHLRGDPHGKVDPGPTDVPLGPAPTGGRRPG